MISTTLRLGAATSAAALLCLTMSPAHAATDPIAKATAEAVQLSALGTPVTSGTFSAAYDGTKQATSGTSEPAINVLAGQSFVTAGTLGQGAVSSASSRHGTALACSGLAGDGASMGRVGSAADCLTGGSRLDLQLGSLDLSSVTLTAATITTGLDPTITTALRPAMATVTSALSRSFGTTMSGLGAPAVVADLDSVQGSCRSGSSGVSGDSSLANATLKAVTRAGSVTLATLPLTPAPNTAVTSDLSGLTTMVTAAVRTGLTPSLNGALGALAGTLDQTAILDNVVANLSTQLAPLSDKALSLTLNKQSSSAANTIDVTALDLQLLPSLTDFGVDPLVLDVGHVSCSSSALRARGGAATPTTSSPATTAASGTAAGAPTTVPKAVAAGVSLAEATTSDPLLLAGGMLILGVGIGCVGSESLRRRSRA